MPSSAATFSLFYHIRAHFFTFFLFSGPYRVTTAGRGNELHFDLACGIVRALQLVLEYCLHLFDLLHLLCIPVLDTVDWCRQEQGKTKVASGPRGGRWGASFVNA
jgi:hypothetical protein